jgi:hypothetical protein
MKSVEERQDELRRIDLWLQQHPMQSNLIAVVIGLLFFAFCKVVLDSPQVFAFWIAYLLLLSILVRVLPQTWTRRIEQIAFHLPEVRREHRRTP